MSPRRTMHAGGCFPGERVTSRAPRRSVSTTEQRKSGGGVTGRVVMVHLQKPAGLISAERFFQTFVFC